MELAAIIDKVRLGTLHWLPSRAFPNYVTCVIDNFASHLPTLG